jgi:hypothetical protein
MHDAGSGHRQGPDHGDDLRQAQSASQTVMQTSSTPRFLIFGQHRKPEPATTTLLSSAGFPKHACARNALGCIGLPGGTGDTSGRAASEPKPALLKNRREPNGMATGTALCHAALRDPRTGGTAQDVQGLNCHSRLALRVPPRPFVPATEMRSRSPCKTSLTR